MTDTEARLRERMAKAVEALDFEEAQRLRDALRLIEEGVNPEDAEQALLLQSMRQRPGAMGLGTGQAKVQPPENWTRPSKPDPLTTGRKKPRSRT